MAAPPHSQRRQLGLSDLPEDVLRLVLTRRALNPSTLLQVAFTCRAAAAIALPELCTNIHVPAIPALPSIFSTLQAHPKLAQQVRSLTTSAYMVSSSRLRQLTAIVRQCRMCPGSTIVSIAKLNKQCNTALLNELPMPWLTRIARLCPNLTSVDINLLNKPELRIFFIGLVDLANILRSRKGKLSCPYVPFSCILVKDRYITPDDTHTEKDIAFVRNVYFVDSVDWSRKRFSILDNLCGSQQTVTELCLTPFRDLVPLGEQGNWAISKATLKNHSAQFDHDDFGGWSVALWLKSKRELKLKAGLVVGEDRLFDFSKAPSVFKGEVEFTVFGLEMLNPLARSVHVDPKRQCKSITTEGFDPEEWMDMPLFQQKTIPRAELQRVTTFLVRPLTHVTSLALGAAFFIDPDTVGAVMNHLARGLPNLTQLRLEEVACPVDILLNHADLLIRRSQHPGVLLEELNVIQYVPLPAEGPTSPWPCDKLRSPASWKLAYNHRPSPLAADKDSAGTRLTVLGLRLDGPGIPHIHPLDMPTVSVHPGILRNLRRLRLQFVQLYLPPHHLAQPDSPSFLPLAHIESPSSNPTAPLTQRTVIPMNGLVTLPKVEQLVINTSSLICPTHPMRIVPRAKQNIVLSTLHALPCMPSVTELRLAVDPSHPLCGIYAMSLIPPFLYQFPTLEFVWFFGQLECDDEWRVEMEEEMFAPYPYPRELSHCPRLRCVQVNGEEPVEYYEWLRREKGEVAWAKVPVVLTPSSVER
ncbi:hypothetical protein BCR44DRAFT_1439723 [Catenaria anguillulae PL171]|uniref:Uncharacterized protein n=1 Tax=Catenaria anguillulae PL171 TaxID=765915 RepID=A0A1Y2HHZ1_9FUNG|nr:hypothetical protein BCR44DRAFT_1439723 [Catenaria anguillulae PL171]